jgi:methylthioribulose-1-phosphate dehydratase
MTSELSSVKSLICCDDLPLVDSPIDLARLQLQEVGALFYEWGWSFGTSSNYSVIVSRQPQRLLITASGKDKCQLGDEDFVLVDEHGKAVEQYAGRPSAETMLHVVLARRPDVGSVLHTHSIWSTLLTDDPASGEGLVIEGYEMLKGLSGVTTHEHREWVPIFDNTQDIPALARRVEDYLNQDARGRQAHGFLIRRHGLYTWGRDLDEARRHVEIFEFLFEVMGRRR